MSHKARQKEKTVTVVGFGQSARNLKPEDLEGEVWSVNNAHMHFPWIRFDRIIDLHPDHYERRWYPKDGRTRWAHYAEQVKQHGVRYIFQEPIPEVYGSSKYPIERVAELAGNYPVFGGSAQYVWALLIKEGFTRVKQYGFDMWAYDHRHQLWQQFFWYGYAHAKGIKMDGVIPQLHTKQPWYAYCPDEQALWEGEYWRQWNGFPCAAFLAWQSKLYWKIVHGTYRWWCAVKKWRMRNEASGS